MLSAKDFHLLYCFNYISAPPTKWRCRPSSSKRFKCACPLRRNSIVMSMLSKSSLLKCSSPTPSDPLPPPPFAPPPFVSPPVPPLTPANAAAVPPAPSPAAIKGEYGDERMRAHAWSSHWQASSYSPSMRARVPKRASAFSTALTRGADDDSDDVASASTGSEVPVSLFPVLLPCTAPPPFAGAFPGALLGALPGEVSVFGCCCC